MGDVSFASVPGTLDGAYFGIPIAGWCQIVALIAALDIAVFKQDPSLPAGDVVQDLPIEWVRYDDPEVKAFKLNAERNNGRAAMLGILGMISHTVFGTGRTFPHREQVNVCTFIHRDLQSEVRNQLLGHSAWSCGNIVECDLLSVPCS